VATLTAGSVLWAGVAAAGRGQRVRTVELTAKWSHYSPAVIRAPRGPRLRIVVRNEDPIEHELIMGDQAVQDSHERGGQSHHSAPEGISVPPNSVAVTWWRVTGNTLFACHLPGHWAYGMRGVVIAG
jgi:uncharacterized cupredoxin-like copper-binding protein